MIFSQQHRQYCIKIFPDFTVARIKYVYTVHHDGRLFAHRGLDDLSTLLVLDYDDVQNVAIQPEDYIQCDRAVPELLLGNTTPEHILKIMGR